MADPHDIWLEGASWENESGAYDEEEWDEEVLRNRQLEEEATDGDTDNGDT